MVGTRRLGRSVVAVAVGLPFPELGEPDAVADPGIEERRAVAAMVLFQVVEHPRGTAQEGLGELAAGVEGERDVGRFAPEAAEVIRDLGHQRAVELLGRDRPGVEAARLCDAIASDDGHQAISSVGLVARSNIVGVRSSRSAPSQ